jgi:hypothetical protein
MAASVRASGIAFEVGSPAPLFRTRRVTGGVASLGPQYTVSRDGRFLFNLPADDAAAAPITLILNWKPGLPTVKLAARARRL